MFHVLKVSAIFDSIVGFSNRKGLEKEDAHHTQKNQNTKINLDKGATQGGFRRCGAATTGSNGRQSIVDVLHDQQLIGKTLISIGQRIPRWTQRNNTNPILGRLQAPDAIVFVAQFTMCVTK